MPLANQDTHRNELRLDDNATVVSAAPSVLVPLLVRRLPVKYERHVQFVEKVQGDDLALELAGGGQVVAGIVRVPVSQRVGVDQRVRANVDRAAA